MLGLSHREDLFDRSAELVLSAMETQLYLELTKIGLTTDNNFTIALINGAIEEAGRKVRSHIKGENAWTTPTR